jgi:hypothetical protein
LGEQREPEALVVRLSLERLVEVAGGSIRSEAP